MASSFVQKVCVITGSSSGIGAMSAVEMARRGARLMLHGRNEAALQKISEKCVAQGISKDDVSYVTGDVREDETLARIRDATMEVFGRIDVLFNNAGFSDPRDVGIHRGGTVEAMDEMYKLYMRAPYVLTQMFVPALTESKGVVINCSSGYSRLPDPNFTGYCTAKAGMDQLTRVLALSLGMRGIRVNSVNPGAVPTEIFNRRFGDGFNDTGMKVMAQVCPLDKQLATAEEIANIVVFLASDQASAITGENVVCDRGITLVHPIMDLQ